MSGLPIQFIVIIVVSTALVIYLLGWSAQSRVEGRVVSHHIPAFGEPLVSNQPNASKSESYIGVEMQSWERIALVVCPLH